MRVIEDTLTSEDFITAYRLEEHIEGGFFREDFRSEIILPKEVTGKKNDRSLITSCYYLLRSFDRAVFHRLASDEIWYFLSGGPVNLYEIDPDGILTRIILGPSPTEGHKLKHMVRRGCWFGVLPEPSIPYAFFSAIVFPGFDFSDWEKGDPACLKELCPEAEKIISQLT